MKSRMKAVRFSMLALLTQFIVVLSINIAVAQEQWNWVEQESGTKQVLRSVVWGDELFVAVGDSGTVVTSPDGNTWTAGNSGAAATLHSVTWGDGLFVAGGDSGTVITSPNGLVWTVRSSGKGYRVGSIVYGDGKYVALASHLYGYDAYALTSGNGIEWVESIELPHSMSIDHLMRAAYGDGKFVGGRSDMGLMISTNGTDWELTEYHSFFPCRDGYSPCGPPMIPIPCMPGPYGMHSIAYGNGIFLILGVAGAQARLENGTSWKLIEPSCNKCPRNGYNVIHDGSRFVVAGGGGIYYTVDGNDYEQMSDKSFGQGVSMAYNGNVYVTVSGTQVGLLQKEKTSLTNPQQRSADVVFNFRMRQNGNILTFTVPSAKAQISLYNIAGKRLKIKPVFHANGTAQIKLSNFAAGTYIVGVRSDKENWQRRIVLR